MHCFDVSSAKPHSRMDSDVARAGSDATAITDMEPPKPIQFSERDWITLFPTFPALPRTTLSGEPTLPDLHRIQPPTFAKKNH